MSSRTTISADAFDLLDAMQDEINMVNRRLDHTMYRVEASAEGASADGAITLALVCDLPNEVVYTARCSTAATAMPAAWHLGGLAILLFSHELY